MKVFTIAHVAQNLAIKFTNLRYVQDVPIGGENLDTGELESRSLILGDKSPLDHSISYHVGIITPDEARQGTHKTYIHNETVYRNVLGRNRNIGQFAPVKLAPVQLLVSLVNILTSQSPEKIVPDFGDMKYIIALGSVHNVESRESLVVAAWEVGTRRKIVSMSCMTHWASPHDAKQVGYLVY